MVKVTFFIFLFFQIFISNSQNNKILKGEFTGENLEKSFINVINVNQYKASISQLDGKFEIEAKAGDSILISSIQYLEIKFLVKPEFFEEGLEIPLKLKVNELNQVNLYSIGLTGNLDTDAKNIKLDESLIMDIVSFNISNAYDENVGTQSVFTLRNVAMEQNPIPASVDFKAVFRLVNRLFKKRNKNSKSTLKPFEQSDKLEDVDFFVNILKINEEKISQFIGYAKENGLTNELLKQSNELDLIQFLMDISEDFKVGYGN